MSMQEIYNRKVCLNKYFGFLECMTISNFVVLKTWMLINKFVQCNPKNSTEALFLLFILLTDIIKLSADIFLPCVTNSFINPHTFKYTGSSDPPSGNWGPYNLTRFDTEPPKQTQFSGDVFKRIATAQMHW